MKNITYVTFETCQFCVYKKNPVDYLAAINNLPSCINCKPSLLFGRSIKLYFVKWIQTRTT